MVLADRGDEAIGSPATYGETLATFLARGSLFIGSTDHFTGGHRRCRPLVTEPGRVERDRSVGGLMMSAVDPLRARKPTGKDDSLELLRRAQSDDGGWGPHLNLPPTFRYGARPAGPVEMRRVVPNVPAA